MASGEVDHRQSQNELTPLSPFYMAARSEQKYFNYGGNPTSIKILPFSQFTLYKKTKKIQQVTRAIIKEATGEQHTGEGLGLI
jgi:hypothetical protein